MARVTVEDCLEKIPNRFALTILAARRARALLENRGTPLIECENKGAVTALREIGAGTVRYNEDVAAVMTEFIEEQRQKLKLTSSDNTFLEAAAFSVIEPIPAATFRPFMPSRLIGWSEKDLSRPPTRTLAPTPTPTAALAEAPA